MRSRGTGMNKGKQQPTGYDLQSLTEPEKRIVMALTYFIKSAAREAIDSVTDLPDSVLDSNLKNLTKASVVKLSPGSKTKAVRYELGEQYHDIAKHLLHDAQAFEAQSRERWV